MSRGDGGVGNDGGIDEPNGDLAASLEGGGISCSTTSAGNSSVLTLAGVAGLVAIAVRRAKRKGGRGE
jgi:MYXO-CTERM domain-containing protein